MLSPNTVNCSKKAAPLTTDRLTRRRFLQDALATGGVVAGGGALGDLLAGSDQALAKKKVPPTHTQQPPNILVIVVDQLRAPQWFQTTGAAAALMPNLARLRSGAVSFASHYTAANDCTPSRASLLTGLYSHQTGALITGGSTLDPGFETWGGMLRESGYDTWWFGKWHLTSHDNKWNAVANAHALEPYGFSGGTYPSPNGGPGQGWRVDPLIAAQFKAWYATAPKNKPWCTTVSFVNPHDIAWWYRWSAQVAAERSAPPMVGSLPANFETPDDLIKAHKPRLQLSLQQTAATGFGPVSYTGSNALKSWLPFMDLYLKLLHEVDGQIGAVMAALESRPALAANTVVVFTSDHGEYGSSHGLRGKGAGAYDEAIRVPLIVKDLRGKLNAAPAQARTGLTSSVDVAPLLLTIAAGSSAWRQQSRYAHIANRHDLSRMLTDPAAAGRPFVLHATDEIVSEFAIEAYSASAPLHVVALRTPKAKYAVYSNWKPMTDTVQSAGQERELYDYSSRNGLIELDNVAGHSRLESALDAQLAAAVSSELREQLPQRLQAAVTRGYRDYYTVARNVALQQAALRAKIERSEPPRDASEKLGAL
jgi:arylsulfatase A-like enzyme